MTLRHKHLYIQLLSLIMVLLCAPVACAEVTNERLQQALETAAKQNQMPGAAAAVGRPDGSVWYGGYGFANLEQQQKFDQHTHCGIGSITKPFLATAFLTLVDQGLLSLDDTVEDILPGLLSVGGQVTMRQLLSMQSGLNHYETNDDFLKTMSRDPRHWWTMEEIARLCDGLAHQPGGRFDYNNGNYFVLALAMEKVTGKKWGEIVQENLLTPLGLEETGIMTGVAQPPTPAAVGYAYEDGQARASNAYYTTSFGGPAGAMYSTLDDLLVWMTAFKEGRLLSAEMRAERIKKAAEVSPGVYTGLGIFLRANGAMGFQGSYNGVYTGMWETYRGYDIAILQNGQAGPQKSDAVQIYQQIVQVIDQHGAEPR